MITKQWLITSFSANLRNTDTISNTLTQPRGQDWTSDIQDYFSHFNSHNLTFDCGLSLTAECIWYCTLHSLSVYLSSDWLRAYTVNSLMHVYVTQANFTTKPRFEIKNKRSFTEMNFQGSRVEKNTHAQNVQMQKILFTNEACWWNLLVWRNHA